MASEGVTDDVPVQTDRYGFIIDDDNHSQQPSQRQIALEHKRMEKWTYMLDNWERFHNSEKLKTRVRKGIPEPFRGLVWQKLLGSRVLYERNEVHTVNSVYSKILKDHDAEAEAVINRDLARTFPRHQLFVERERRDPPPAPAVVNDHTKTEEKEGEDTEESGQSALANNLRGFAVYKREIGYCQGMGFIDGILLMYMSEREAFWALRQMILTKMPGIFDPGFPRLQVRFKQWAKLLEHREPAVARVLKRHNIDPSFYTTQWFMTLFIYNAPFGVAIRVMDSFILEGVKIIFRMGLAYIQTVKRRVLKADFEGAMTALQKEPLTITMFNEAMKIKLSRKEYEVEEDRWASST